MNIKKQEKRVLVIEDDRGFAELMKRWLTLNTNWDVSLAFNGLEGSESASSSNWDLIISDVNLPQMNGFDLVKYCKENVPSVPVLLITAQESMEYALKALRTKADDLLIKPFTRGDVVEKAVGLLRTASELKKRSARRVLAIGAHPDDIEIGCGGILSRHVAEGDEISILTLSDGEIGGDNHSRIRESEAAAKKLGASLFWGNLTDTRIGSGRETISVIENCVRSVNPSIVYTHTSNDQHQDHRNVHLASIVACRGVGNLYCYQSPSSTIDFRPTYFGEISEFIDKKLDLIDQYATQTSKCSYLARDLITSTAMYWGRFAGNKVVEPLEVIRESK